MKDNKQPLKQISHQDIFALQDILEQLKSWSEPLSLLENYFSDTNRPVNKQQLAKQYYARSKVFLAFNADFQKLVKEMETRLTLLKNSKKLER